MPVDLRYRLQYRGQSADDNMLPAHLGATSLEGVTWSYSILANYLATGEIRQRGQMADAIRVYMKPARQGSFVQDLVVYVTAPENMFLTTVIGTYTVATIGQVVNAFIGKALREVLGLLPEQTSREERWFSKFPSGDMEALVDRIEPSMKRAHSVVGDGATDLLIVRGRVPVVTLDAETKLWVNTNIVDKEIKQRIVRISAFNANTGNGRAYLPDIGKTTPFSIGREPDQGTYETISWSLNEYTGRRTCDIQLNVRDVLSVDGRVKKIIIEGAYRLP